MQNFLNRAAKVTAVLLAILFVLTTLFALLLYNVEKTAFDAELYKNALYNENFYDRLPNVLGEQLSREAELESCLEDALGEKAYYSLYWNGHTPTKAELQYAAPCFEKYGYPQERTKESDFSPYTKNLTAKDWESLIISFFPPEELQDLSEESIDQVFAYLNGETLAIHIPLKPIKKKLTSEDGLEAVLTFLRAQPDCTLGELGQLATGEIIYCNPPEEVLAMVSPTLKTELPNAAEKLPDKFTFPSEPTNRENLAAMQIVRLTLRLSPLIAVGLLLLVTIFAVRSLKGWLHWWGIPLLISGIIGLIIGVITMPIIRLSLDVLLFGQLPPEVSSGVSELGFDLLTSVIHGISETIVLQALIIAILGLGMTIGAVFIKQESS